MCGHGGGGSGSRGSWQLLRTEAIHLKSEASASVAFSVSVSCNLGCFLSRCSLGCHGRPLCSCCLGCRGRPLTRLALVRLLRQVGFELGVGRALLNLSCVAITISLRSVGLSDGLGRNLLQSYAIALIVVSPSRGTYVGEASPPEALAASAAAGGASAPGAAGPTNAAAARVGTARLALATTAADISVELVPVLPQGHGISPVARAFLSAFPKRSFMQSTPQSVFRAVLAAILQSQSRVRLSCLCSFRGYRGTHSGQTPQAPRSRRWT
jgi:hypothetical protein